MFRITGAIDGWDIEGTGETREEAVKAYIADCREGERSQRALADALALEAETWEQAFCVICAEAYAELAGKQ